MPTLPTSVDDDFADSGVSVITFPSGTWTLDRILERNYPVTINMEGCTLEAAPDATAWGNAMYLIWIRSAPDTTIWDESPGGTDRTMSKLSGTVVIGTTQLTMDAAEVPVGLAAGEKVLLVLGVDTSDPVEPYYYHRCTITDVNAGTRVITFDPPVPVNVPDYVDEAGLEAAMNNSSLNWKAEPWGDWPSDANFSKGFGTDHGLKRYDGGMLDGVTINDMTVNLSTTVGMAAGDITNGASLILAQDMVNLRVNRLNANNPLGSILALSRCFDAYYNGVTLTGQSVSKIGASKQAGNAFDFSGGDGLTFNDITITAKDCTLYNAQANSRNLRFSEVDYNVEYTSHRNFASAPAILGSYSVLNAVQLDGRVKATTSGGTAHTLHAGDLDFGRFIYPQNPLTALFDFRSTSFIEFSDLCQIALKGYGPRGVEDYTETILHGANFRDILFPEMVLPGSRFRITDYGDLRALTDSFGNSYWAAAASNAWVELTATHWFIIGAGTTNLSNWQGKYLRFWLNNAGSTADATVEFEFITMPVRLRKKFYNP